MIASPATRKHSAKVSFDLYINEQRFPLAQIGGNRLIFDEPVVLPGTSGEIRAMIDDFKRRWIVTWEHSDEPRRVIPAEYRNP